MEVVAFIAEDGHKLYAIGPFKDKASANAAADRASAGLNASPASMRHRPSGAITGRAWAIFDLLQGKPRGELIAECERQGIKKGTAGAQYSRWARARKPDSRANGDSRNARSS